MKVISSEIHRQRLAALLRAGKDLSPSEIVEKALLMALSVHRKPGNHGSIEWYLGVERFPSYATAYRERLRRALAQAIKWSDTGLPGLVKYGFPVMPATMRRMAEAMLPRAPRTRGGWKWSPEARARLSKARTGSTPAGPRKRGYPLFTLTPGFEIPATGHRFTVTRADLETLRGMIFPPGME